MYQRTRACSEILEIQPPVILEECACLIGPILVSSHLYHLFFDFHFPNPTAGKGTLMHLGFHSERLARTTSLSYRAARSDLSDEHENPSGLFFQDHRIPFHLPFVYRPPCFFLPLLILRGAVLNCTELSELAACERYLLHSREPLSKVEFPSGRGLFSR